MLEKFIDSFTFSRLTDSNEYVVIASNYPKFYAVKKKEENTLFILFNKYTFRKNDQIVDEHDMSYFVKEVDSNVEFEAGNHTYTVQKITYEEKPLPMPSYVMQTANSSINVNVSGSTVSGMNVQSTISQQISYAQILSDLENVISNCFHIKEYKEMITIFKASVSKQEPIEESKVKKFFKFMGTQVKHLVELFITSFATALANKVAP